MKLLKYTLAGISLLLSSAEKNHFHTTVTIQIIALKYIIMV